MANITKIKAKRERGGKVLEGSFTEMQWKSGDLQKAGWKLASSDLSSEKEESKISRDNVSVAMQEELSKKNDEIASLEMQLRYANDEIFSLKGKIETPETQVSVEFRSDEPKRRGPKPKDKV